MGKRDGDHCQAGREAYSPGEQGAVETMLWNLITRSILDEPQLVLLAMEDNISRIPESLLIDYPSLLRQVMITCQAGFEHEG